MTEVRHMAVSGPPNGPWSVKSFPLGKWTDERVEAGPFPTREEAYAAVAELESDTLRCSKVSNTLAQVAGWMG